MLNELHCTLGAANWKQDFTCITAYEWQKRTLQSMDYSNSRGSFHHICNMQAAVCNIKSILSTAFLLFKTLHLQLINRHAWTLWDSQSYLQFAGNNQQQKVTLPLFEICVRAMLANCFSEMVLCIAIEKNPIKFQACSVFLCFFKMIILNF